MRRIFLGAMAVMACLALTPAREAPAVAAVPDPSAYGWTEAGPDECVGIKDVAWWAKQAFGKLGMSGPLKVMAGGDWTAWTREGADFVLVAEWRPGEDCLKAWRIAPRNETGGKG